jgi:predicted RNase H-like HicB family nuclease
LIIHSLSCRAAVTAGFDNPGFFSADKSHKLTRVGSEEKKAMKIQASFVKDGKWWVAWSDDVPGALTQGATLKEARENLADAVRMIREPVDLSKLPKSKVVIEQLEV